MSIEIEKKLESIPVVRYFVIFLKKVRLSMGGGGFTLYDLIELYIVGIVKGIFTYRSGAIAFSFFMAIFPFLLVILNLIPYIPIDGFREDFLHFLETLLPPKTSDFFSGVFYDIANNKRGGLLSSVGLLCILLMSSGVNAIFGGFEHSYHVRLTRSIIRQYAIAVLVAILLALLLLIIVAVFLYFQVYVKSLGVIDDADFDWLTWTEYGMFIGVVYLFSSILYYFGVRHEYKRRFFTPGAVLTTTLTLLTTYIFAIYINEFSRYNELYGSIGAVLILMLYLWLNCNILLLGFELNASMISLKRVKMES